MWSVQLKFTLTFRAFLNPLRKHMEKQRCIRDTLHLLSACMFVSRVAGFSKDPITYVGENAEKILAEKLEQLARQIYERFKVLVPMIFNETGRQLHDSQNVCYACGREFDNNVVELSKVRDHCHYTDRYQGALHSKCNLRLKRTRVVPVLFHNLKGYDSHLFVTRLADTPGDVSCIPQNEEKYVTFSKNVLVDTIQNGNEEDKIWCNLKFIDTMSFMQTSLEKLVNNMEKPMFKHTTKYFQDEKLDLMLRKGV